MRESSVHLLLCSLFDFLLRSEEYGYPPINILHRIATEGHAAPAGRPGHRILCEDMDRDLRQCQMAFNTLSLGDRIVVVCKHMPPPQFAGLPMYKKWGDVEKARYLQVPTKTFKTKYKGCTRKMKKCL